MEAPKANVAPPPRDPKQLAALGLYTTPESILTAIPASALPKGPWNDAAYLVANRALQEHVKPYKGQYEGIVDLVTREHDRVTIRFARGNTMARLRTVYYYRVPLFDPLGDTVKEGDKIKVTGRFYRLLTKSSEVPVLVVDLAAILPAPSKTFGSLQEILRTLPPDALQPVGKWSELHSERATRLVQAAALNQYAAMSLKVEKIERTKEGRYAGLYRMRADMAQTSNVKFSVWCYFDDDVPRDRLERIRPGSTIRVIGVISRCDLGKGTFNVDLLGATLPN